MTSKPDVDCASQTRARRARVGTGRSLTHCLESRTTRAAVGAPARSNRVSSGSRPICPALVNLYFGIIEPPSQDPNPSTPSVVGRPSCSYAIFDESVRHSGKVILRTAPGPPAVIAALVIANSHEARRRWSCAMAIVHGKSILSASGARCGSRLFPLKLFKILPKRSTSEPRISG